MNKKEEIINLWLSHVGIKSQLSSSMTNHFRAWWTYQATDRHFKNYKKVRFEDLKVSRRSMERFQGEALKRSVAPHLQSHFGEGFYQMNYCLTNPQAVEEVSYDPQHLCLNHLTVGPYSLYLPKNRTEYLLGGSILRNCSSSLEALSRNLLDGKRDCHVILSGKLVAVIELEKLHNLEESFILGPSNRRVTCSNEMMILFSNAFKKLFPTPLS